MCSSVAKFFSFANSKRALTSSEAVMYRAWVTKMSKSFHLKEVHHLVGRVLGIKTSK